MKIDRVRIVHLAADWDYHEAHSEATLARPSYIYPELRTREHFFPLGDHLVGHLTDWTGIFSSLIPMRASAAASAH